MKTWNEPDVNERLKILKMICEIIVCHKKVTSERL